MSAPRSAACAGSSNRPSKTRLLAEEIASRAIARFGGLRDGAGARHPPHLRAFLDADALMVEHPLRPLLGFFEAQSLATGIHASAADFNAHGLADRPVSRRVDRAAGQVAAHLSPACAAPPRAAGRSSRSDP